MQTLNNETTDYKVGLSQDVFLKINLIYNKSKLFTTNVFQNVLKIFCIYPFFYES